jgi:hypothetical protein
MLTITQQHYVEVLPGSQPVVKIGIRDLTHFLFFFPQTQNPHHTKKWIKKNSTS